MKITKFISKDYPIVSSELLDTKLKNNLNELLKKAGYRYFCEDNSMKLTDWVEEDYKNFLYQLKLLDLPIYEKMYPYLNYLMTLPKTEIKKELVRLDALLELHVFDEERIFTTDLQENNQIESKMEWKSHHFNCGDMVRFINSLYSKLLQTASIAFQNNQSKFSSENGIEKINNFNIILDAVNKNDEQVIAVILKPYYSYIARLCNDPYLYSLLRGMEETILSIFKRNVFMEIEKLKNQQERQIKNYSKELSDRISDYQIKRNVNGRRIK